MSLALSLGAGSLSPDLILISIPCRNTKGSFFPPLEHPRKEITHKSQECLFPQLQGQQDLNHKASRCFCSHWLRWHTLQVTLSRMSWKHKQVMKTDRKDLMLAHPIANADARVPRADFMLKAGADFIHIQAG